MTGVHAPDVYIQMGCNHINAIKCEALGGTSIANPSGIPNTVTHNRKYRETRWGE